jgi:hypothetical protein
MKVIGHRISQSTYINMDSGEKIAEPTELQKRLLALKDAINKKLASRGLAIMDLAYHPEKDAYHYCVPASYKAEDYPLIKQTVEDYCGCYNPSDPFFALNSALVVIASGVTEEQAKLRAIAIGCSTPIIAKNTEKN